MKHNRRWCWRCAAWDAWFLFVGVSPIGWYAMARNGRLQWLIDYWPNYCHPHGWGIACVHGVWPREHASGRCV